MLTFFATPCGERSLDCELIVMEEGAEALAFVRQQGKYAGIPVPDLAILDLNVPKHDGLEVLEAMRMSRVFRRGSRRHPEFFSFAARA
jgi:two-component system response regulator